MLYLHSVLMLAALGWTAPLSLAGNTNSSEECDLFYMHQPSTAHSCNPYNSRVRLHCVLYRHEGLEQYRIEWYHRQIEGNVTQKPTLLSTDTNYDDGLLKGRLVLGRHVGWIPGDYWCQVRLKGEEKSTLVPSDAFRLLPKKEYDSYPPCRNIILSQQKAMCARNGAVLPLLSLYNSDSVLTTNSNDSAPSSDIEEQLVLVVSASTISATSLLIIVLLLTAICCLQRSKSKLKSKLDSKSVNASTETFSVDSQLQHVSYHDFETQPLANHVPSLERSVENSGYVNLLESSYTIAPVNSSRARDLPLPSSVNESLPVSLSNTLSTAVNGEALYRSLDMDTQEDSHEYTDRRRPPPVSPKKPALKARSLLSKTPLGVNKLAVLINDPPSAEQSVLSPPKLGINGTELPSTAHHLSLPARQYQPLSPSTKEAIPVYTSRLDPADTPDSPTVTELLCPVATYGKSD